MPLPWRRRTNPLVSLSRSRHGCRPVVRPCLEALEDRYLLATFTVFNTLDDLNPGSLRREILDANATPGPNMIRFSIGSGVQIIAPTSGLPTITGPTTLDGTTQPGYAGTPLIVLDGSAAGNFHGLVLAGGGATVQGLVIGHFVGDGVLIQSSNNVVNDDYLGTDASGTVAAPNAVGVDIQGGSNNTIGLSGPGNGNLLSGNSVFGLRLLGTGVTGNVVQHNLIGVAVNGTSALANGLDGVEITGGAASNTIGGGGAAVGNVISGNTYFGVLVDHSSGNVLASNLLGMSQAGTGALANGAAGVALSNAAGNTVGSSYAGQGNFISGNGGFGILLEGSGSSVNVVAGNAIGTNVGLTAAVPNAFDGIFVTGAAGNVIGTTPPGGGNVISGNGRFGIFLQGSGTSNNRVDNNLIGLSGAGGALPNGADGVAVLPGATNNTIGGTVAGTGNVISGNARFGVYLLGPGESPAQGASTTSGNLVQGNRIGTDVYARAPVPNAVDGMAVFTGADDNTIGGATPAARNIISGNAQYGILLALVSGEVVQGNFLGTDGSGTAALGNGSAGVDLSATSNNTIGGTAAGAGNLISGNPEGLILTSTGTSGNVVQGNFIGTDFSGSHPILNALGNNVQVGGIDLVSGASGNTIGGTSLGAGNVISGNNNAGILFADSNGNVVEGNNIGTDRTGSLPVPNNGFGIFLSGAAVNTIGGTVVGAGNVIAFNSGPGVAVGSLAADAGTTGNSILGNRIFSNSKLGIDLGSDGVTANTPGGPHAGPNDFQNFPVINSVTPAGGGLDINVSLNSTPSHTFRLEFFANAAADASGHGQGQTFLGAANVTTDGSGNVTQTVQLANGLPSGQNILSATATDLTTGDTSEFSADFTVT